MKGSWCKVEQDTFDKTDGELAAAFFQNLQVEAAAAGCWQMLYVEMWLQLSVRICRWRQ